MVTRNRRCANNNFGRKMELLFSVIVLELVFVSGQYVQSPCPGIFDYHNNGGQVSGVITLQPSGPTASVTIRANFTIAARLPSSYVGQLQPVDHERGLQRYNQGAPLLYRVHFPVTSPLPRLYSLVVNDQQICYGPMDLPGPNQYVSTISLQHMLFLRGGINSVYPGNRPNFVKPSSGFNSQGDTQLFSFSDDKLGAGFHSFVVDKNTGNRFNVYETTKATQPPAVNQFITQRQPPNFNQYPDQPPPDYNPYTTQRQPVQPPPDYNPYTTLPPQQPPPDFNPYTTQRPRPQPQPLNRFNVYETTKATQPPAVNQFITQGQPPNFNQYPDQPPPDYNPYTTQRQPVQPPLDYNPYTTLPPQQPPPDFNPYTTQRPRPQPQPLPANPPRSPSGSDFSRVECGTVAGGNEKQVLIHNGQNYERGEWPWLVAIYKRMGGGLSFACGGTLISDKHVVTAAHCISVRTSITSERDVVVKIGVYDLDDWSDDQIVTRGVLSPNLHESFNSTTISNDIAVFTLDKSVEFTNNIRPVCLWEGNADLNRIIGASGVVAGWGSTELGAGGRGKPRMARVPVVSTSTCRASKPDFHKLTSDTTLCAGDRTGIGPCLGDSGGGLYILDNGRWRLRGIVSLSLRPPSGENTCLLDQYIVFTDAAKYNPWIRNIVRSSQI